ncbi:cytochrome P450 [Streptomyces winkii]|uniref:cytochrome P450 n=1 Tax=Streptomyces winkii TaxID=3051178 RepID=UPI0028D0F2F7|nr:cytochrome P450 [Streptomyces sp. DSM 40971]
MTRPDGADQRRGHGGNTLWPRRRSRRDELTQRLEARDPPVAGFVSGDAARTVYVAGTTPSRARLLRLREEHYASTLAAMGVPVWDVHDEDALHLLCSQHLLPAPAPPEAPFASGPRAPGALDSPAPRTAPAARRGEPVGGIRVTLNEPRRGDLHEDFARLPQVVGDEGAFWVFARELVHPAHRGTEVSTVLAHAACLYLLERSPVRRVMFTTIAGAGHGAPRGLFGATPVAPPVPLGPQGRDVALFAGDLATLAEETAVRLERTGWSVSLPAPPPAERQPQVPAPGLPPAAGKHPEDTSVPDAPAPARSSGAPPAANGSAADGSPGCPAGLGPTGASALDAASGGGPLSLPFPHDVPGAPPSIYRRLRAERPVCPVRMATGDTAWLVTRSGDARFVLADSRFSKAALLAPDAPRTRPGALPRGLLFTTDPPEHTRLRSVAAAALSKERTEALRPVAARLAAQAAARLERRQRADLVRDFARPLAMGTMCALLGVPEDEADDFAGWAETVLTTGPAPDGEVERAQDELMACTRRLVTRRADAPAGDAMSALLGPDGDVERAVSLVATLMAAGYETMVASVANSALLLLAGEGGLPAPWPDDPGALVEELLRLSTFGDALRSRRATADLRIGGELIRSGDVVLVSLASVNRDEAVYDDPDRPLPGRRARHMAFGHGARRCPASRPARMELAVAMERLTRSFPGMRLAVAPQEIVLRSELAESCPESLPVLLGPRPAGQNR